MQWNFSYIYFLFLKNLNDVIDPDPELELFLVSKA
jgi:hypothetical protein